MLQKTEGVWKPIIAFASRALTPTERRYAQIEKEALAICWATEKFSYFLSGNKFIVETDHKPLVSVLGEKELSKLPIRVQRFRLRMMAYSYSVMYTPGHKLVLADALSRSPVADSIDLKDVEDGISLEIANSMPISPRRLQRLTAATLEDAESALLTKYITEKWPSHKELEESMKPYYSFRDYLTVVQGLIYFNSRIFYP